MTDQLEAVLATVRERVTPSADERERLEETASILQIRTEEAVNSLPVEADVIRVGSSSRDTWLRGDRDIDIFVCFDPDLSRAELERYGLEVGNRVLPDGRMEYAEHPYVSAEYAGYAVDLVPCYAVADASEIRSAVDRTPFHAEYIAGRLTEEQAVDVRVFKRFCESIGVYGSNLKTQGFSGYLSELLILEYGDFPSLIDGATTWNPPVYFDPASHAAETFDGPLVVIDPTDPTRNVAAVVTAATVSRFQHYARQFRDEPSLSFFESTPADPITETQLLEHIANRQTTPVGIRVSVPEMVDDQLYPQLRTSMHGIANELDQHGFGVVRAACDAVDTALMYLEVESAVLPAVERHTGPPVHVTPHADAFLSRWDSDAAYGPFIDGNRYVVERYRDVRSIAAVFERDRLDKIKLGRDIRQAMEHSVDILVGEDVTALLPEYSRTLGAFYDPRP